MKHTVFPPAVCSVRSPMQAAVFCAQGQNGEFSLWCTNPSMTNPAPLTGLAIGDALGMPFELESPLSTHITAWTGDFQSSAFHRLKPGQWTDDTQMSVAVAEAMLESKFYDPVTTARKYLGWYQSGDCRGIGTSTEQAMRNLVQGKEWHQAGIEKAEGNGTAMRAAVIGAFQKGTERLRSAAHWSRIDASITHQTDEAREGSAAMAVAACYLCTGGRKDGLLTTVFEHTERSQVRQGLEDVYRGMRRGDTIGDFLKTKDWLVAGVNPHVVQSVPAAFACFVFSSNYENTVMNAIKLGGDTDTVAAMAGALAGSHYGYEAIPEKLRQPLERASFIRDIELRLLQP